MPADEEMLEGRLNAMIAMYQGLPVRAVHNPDMKVEPLIAGFRIPDGIAAGRVERCAPQAEKKTLRSSL